MPEGSIEKLQEPQTHQQQQSQQRGHHEDKDRQQVREDREQQDQQQQRRGKGRPKAKLGPDPTGRSNIRHLTDDQKDEKLYHLATCKNMVLGRARATDARIERLLSEIDRLEGVLGAIVPNRELVEAFIDAHEKCLAANVGDRFRAKGESFCGHVGVKRWCWCKDAGPV